MSKKDRAKKANVRKGQIRAKRETEEIIKRIKKDQFRWQSEKVN